jgi:hypothetical protein
LFQLVEHARSSRRIIGPHLYVVKPVAQAGW